MRKILLTTFCYAPNHEMQWIFPNHILPKFEKYCEIHGFELVVLTSNIVYPKNINWGRMEWIKNELPHLKDGDIITHIDADSVIMKFDQEFVFNKDFAIPIESTGMICMGFYSIRISEWSRKLIHFMTNAKYYNEHVFTDNAAIYEILGLDINKKELPPLNHPNVQLLPTEYNVTYMPGEFKRPRNEVERIIKKCALKKYRVKKEDIIIRHLAAGTILREYAKKYYEN